MHIQEEPTYEPHAISITIRSWDKNTITTRHVWKDDESNVNEVCRAAVKEARIIERAMNFDLDKLDKYMDAESVKDSYASIYASAFKTRDKVIYGIFVVGGVFGLVCGATWLVLTIIGACQ